ncbi:MAG: hypothetical protein EAZ58_02640 [Flavobacterium sp.]|nr:MAG: hypothetical protein EAZ58_02640 [Flavobacterium sp.]
MPLKKYWFISLLFVLQTVAQNNNNLIFIPALPTKEVYKVHIDKKGFLWVAHELGISRYDGIAFTHFNFANASSLSIADVAEDAEGRIWCNNISGQVFFIEKEKMNLLTEFDYQNQKTINYLGLVDSQLLVTSYKGLFEYNIYTKKSRYISYCNNKKMPAILNGVVTKKGYLLNSRTNWFLYKTNKQMVQLKIANYNLIDKWIGENNLFYSNDTVYFKNRISGITHVATIKNDSLVFFENKQPIIYNTSVYEYKKADVWLHYNNPDIDISKSFLKKFAITDVVKDKEGNVWMSSHTAGLILYVNKELYAVVQPVTVPKKEVAQQIFINNKTTYISTNNVFYEINNNTIKRFAIPSKFGSIDKFYVTNKPHLILISTPLHPIFLDLTTKQQVHLPYTPSIKEAIFFKNKVLCATPAGLQLFSIDKTPLRAQQQDSLIIALTGIDKEKLTQRMYQRTRSVAYDEINKIIYLALKDGVVAIQKEGIFFLKHNNANIYAISLLLLNNTLYIGTLNNGLLCIDKNTKQIKQISTNNGLLSNSVVKIKYLNKYLWVVGINGVQQFDCIKQQFVNEYMVPQVSGTSIRDIEIKDTTIYFSTMAGVYSTLLKQISNKKKPLNYFQYAIFNKDTIYTNSIIKSHRYNNVQIKVAAIWFSNPRAVFFKYRVIKDNKVERWVNLEKGQRIISFQDVNPGNYTLQAVAVNEFNAEAENPIQFNFTILKPWYKTNIAYVAYILLAVISGYVILQLRINYIKSRNNLLVEKLQLQNQLGASVLTAIKSQMNPHFVFNALNTIKSYIYTNNKQEANVYLNKFSNLIRFVLEASEKEKILLSEEINMLQLYVDLEKMRFEDDLQVHIKVADTIDTDNLYIPTMMLQPFVENAIKHGLLHKEGSKELEIQFLLNTNTNNLYITIKDNGVGRAKSKELNKRREQSHTSFATLANQKRIEIINQQLQTNISLHIIDETNGTTPTGTTVEIKIPINVLTK